MATVHFLYRSTREKSCLELRLQHTENTIKYLWSAKTKIEVSKEYWTKHHKINSRDVVIRKQHAKVNNIVESQFKEILPKLKRFVLMRELKELKQVWNWTN